MIIKIEKPGYPVQYHEKGGVIYGKFLPVLTTDRKKASDITNPKVVKAAIKLLREHDSTYKISVENL